MKKLPTTIKMTQITKMKTPRDGYLTPAATRSAFVPRWTKNDSATAKPRPPTTRIIHAPPGTLTLTVLPSKAGILVTTARHYSLVRNIDETPSGILLHGIMASPRSPWGSAQGKWLPSMWWSPPHRRAEALLALKPAAGAPSARRRRAPNGPLKPGPVSCARNATSFYRRCYRTERTLACLHGT